MATNIGTELRRLLKKLGGTPSKYDQTNELIHKITDQVEPSGGGGGALIEEFTWTDSGYETGYYSTDDAEDIFDAYKAGKTVIFHFPENSNSQLDEAYITLLGLQIGAEAGEGGVYLADNYLHIGNSASDMSTLTRAKIINGKLAISPYID